MKTLTTWCGTRITSSLACTPLCCWNGSSSTATWSAPCHYQFCLGVLGGMPATVENLIYLKDRIPTGSTWSAFGIGAAHLPILYAALALGGHIRVGMEDNVIFGKDENGKKIMATNQMLVQRAVEAVKLFGNQPATPAEAREILGIPPLVR